MYTLLLGFLVTNCCLVELNVEGSILNNTISVIKNTFDFVEANFFGRCEPPPENCSTDKIMFYLNNSKKNQRKVHLDDEDLSSNLQTFLDKNAPTKFIIHGYTGSANNPLMKDLRDAYFDNNKIVNIISVDYEILAEAPCYITLFRSRQIIGECCAELITKIKTETKLNITQMHVIGFSFGAQVAAQVANSLKFKLDHITGLDPAWPLFVQIPFAENKGVLSKIHADFVDVIHTNAGGRGIPTSNAHYDFYANGGKKQPDCDDSICSHIKSVKYFIKTIYGTKFWAIKCSYWSLILGRCQKFENGKVLVGELATKPESRDEGPYVFYT